MSNVAQMIEESGRGSLPRENNGLPSLNLDSMQGISVPGDYEVEGVLGDILMCEVADESESGEVLREGLWIKPDITAKLWRVGRVVCKGPDTSSNINVGALIMYPSDKGIPMIKHKKKYIFLNEGRVFCTLKNK